MSQLIEFAARLKAARELAGYKQAIQLARELDLEKTRYSHYEGGRRLPSDSLIMEMSQKLGVSPQWLKSGEGEPFSEEDVETNELADKNKLDELIDLKLKKLDRPAPTKATQESEFDEALMMELLIHIGNLPKAIAKKVCHHYSVITASENNLEQRIKITKTLFALSSKG